MASDAGGQAEKDRLAQIEELRAELHRRMGGHYDPRQMARLVGISQELDKLVVEVTRQQWSEVRKKQKNRS
ncbi:MAG: Spo0E family sporulation regulatory protein-aspartic acid phosphatase [Bacillota bacterium]